MAKTAENVANVPVEKPKLTAERAIAEIRSLRAGGLFVGNMEYVDKLLEDYDRRGRENMCDVCGGTGKVTSASSCMCGGTGLMSRAAEYLREELVKMQFKYEGIPQPSEAVSEPSIVQEGVPS